ncbi:MAG: hypothetical protein LC808_11610 [Actinobacteria bacterium]|nr:hypothetical protein [Actinomycetota bacterium]
MGVFAIFIVYNTINQNREDADNADQAKIGDCLAFDESKGEPYTRRSCDHPRAPYKVYGIEPYGTSGTPGAITAECITTPGTSRSVSTKQGYLCIGEKDVDVAKSINNVQVGECVVTTGDSAQKAACDLPESRPVLAVLKDVLKISGVRAASLPTLCIRSGAKDTKTAYAWSLEQQPRPGGPIRPDLPDWDRVMCLGD